MQKSCSNPVFSHPGKQRLIIHTVIRFTQSDFRHILIGAVQSDIEQPQGSCINSRNRTAAISGNRQSRVIQWYPNGGGSMARLCANQSLIESYALCCRFPFGKRQSTEPLRLSSRWARRTRFRWRQAPYGKARKPAPRGGSNQ